MLWRKEINCSCRWMGGEFGNNLVPRGKEQVADKTIHLKGRLPGLLIVINQNWKPSALLTQEQIISININGAECPEDRAWPGKGSLQLRGTAKLISSLIPELWCSVNTNSVHFFFFFSFLTTLCPAISVIIRNHFHYIWSNYSLWWGVKYISVIPLWLEVEITLILFFCVISFWGGCMCAKFGTDLQVWVSMLQKKIFLEPEGILKIEQKSFGSILLLMELEIEGLLFDLRGRIKFNLE